MKLGFSRKIRGLVKSWSIQTESTEICSVLWWFVWFVKFSVKSKLGHTTNTSTFCNYIISIILCYYTTCFNVFWLQVGLVAWLFFFVWLWCSALFRNWRKEKGRSTNSARWQGLWVYTVPWDGHQGRICRTYASTFS